jgi:uncharacterized protein
LDWGFGFGFGEIITMTMELQQKLLTLLAPAADSLRVDTVRISLGYTAVRLSDGSTGLAWTPPATGGSCTHLDCAGSLAGMPAGELLRNLVDAHPLRRSLGLATANALLAPHPHPDATTVDALEPLAVTEGDHVAMVGYFGPLVRGLKQTGCRLDIIELDSSRPGTLSPEAGRSALAACDVAILTGTSLVTGTIDELLASLGQPRAAVLLGPSSPFCPEAFAGTRLTQISGARVIDSEAVLRVVSEAGGTPLLKPYVAFETVPIRG